MAKLVTSLFLWKDEFSFDDEESDADDSRSYDDDDDDFTPTFDIMALLDEQLDSYAEMSLTERMEEIDVMTMEVSLEELAAFVKENRKRR